MGTENNAAPALETGTNVDWSSIDKQLADSGDFKTETPESEETGGETGQATGAEASQGAESASESEAAGGIDDIEESAQSAESDNAGAEAAEKAEESEAEKSEDEQQIDSETIDYETAIPLSAEGETLTVGELKDHWENRVNEQAAFDDERRELQDDRIGLAEVVEMIEPHLPPAVIEKIKAQRSQSLGKENAKLLAAFPEWKDPQVKQAARDSMRELCEFYGVSEREFETVGDHRIIRILADYAKLRRVARDKITPVRKTRRKQSARRGSRRRVGATDKLVADAVKSNNPDVKDAAISKLLNG